MMMGVRLVAGSRLSLRHNSVPLIPGNIRSNMINDGGSFSLRAAARPASPVAAVIAGQPSRSKLYRKLSEMSGSSSMIRIGRCIYVGQASLPVFPLNQKQDRQDEIFHFSFAISHLPFGFSAWCFQ
jgi:hypothetical protein